MVLLQVRNPTTGMLFWSGLPIFCFPNPFQTSTQLCHRIEPVLKITMVLHSTPYLFWKARYGTCRVLFTHSIRATPTIQSTYYISSERSFQLEYSAIEILGIGPVVMEIFRN